MHAYDAWFLIKSATLYTSLSQWWFVFLGLRLFLWVLATTDKRTQGFVLKQIKGEIKMILHLSGNQAFSRSLRKCPVPPSTIFFRSHSAKPQMSSCTRCEKKNRMNQVSSFLLASVVPNHKVDVEIYFGSRNLVNANPKSMIFSNSPKPHGRLSILENKDCKQQWKGDRKDS